MNVTRPPIAEDAYKWLQNYISPQMRVFEYGSGSSTLYFGNNVQLIVSIEHSPNKFYKLENHVKKVRYNFVYKLIQPVEDPTPFPYSHISYGTTNANYLCHNFKNYVNYINEYLDNFFDVIFINGMSRASSIVASTWKIKKNGIIALNNSGRYVYQDAIHQFLDKHTAHHFGKGDNKTSIYEIK